MGGKRWTATVAGLPCTIEAVGEGWVVTIASTTISRGPDLAAVIADAGGGLVGRDEAKAVAALVAPRTSHVPVAGR